MSASDLSHSAAAAVGAAAGAAAACTAAGAGANLPRKVTLLGATGSIGDATCEILRAHPELYQVHALAAHANAQKMLELIREFHPAQVAMSDPLAAERLRSLLQLADAHLAAEVEVFSGNEGVETVAGSGEADMVVAAIVGAAGLKPVLAAIKTGCRICLANKEALVMSGQLFFDEAKKYHAEVLPVDSEHSAIFQCLPPSEQVRMGFCELNKVGVSSIILTGSGGPFRDCPLEHIKEVTPEEAVNHPVWSMGPKISVDSATMMNKALEYIEARYLFNAAPDQIKVVIHPQSVIHSMVSYVDGAVMAQMGQPSMKTPIAHAMAYPQRIDATVPPLDFARMATLSFREPDPERYPCLFAGIEASKSGQACTTALNAANEVAVAAFLERRLPFVGIGQTVDHVLERIAAVSAYSLEEIMNVDARARQLAAAFIASRS